MQQESLVLPNNEFRCIPIGIHSSSSEAGPRLGGRAPENVTPFSDMNSYKYFLTVPLMKEPYLEVSVFITPLDFLLPVSGVLQNQGLVQIVIHNESRRGPVNSLTSELSEHALSLELERPDWEYGDDGEKIIATFSKLGGRPYINQQKHELSVALSNASSAKYRHFLQITFPGGTYDTDIVNGNWPFADGIFHIFCRPPFQVNDWSWLLEY